MKIVFSLFTFLLFHASTQAQAPFNLGFEDNGLLNDIAPWNRTNFSKKAYKITLDSSTKNSGKYSLRISYDTTGTGRTDGQVVNEIPIDVLGNVIKVSGYAKTLLPGDSALLHFAVRQDKGLKKAAHKSFWFTGGKDWERVSFEFNLDTFQLPVHSLLISSYLKSKGSFWLDDLRIEVDGKDMFSQLPYSSARGEIVAKLSPQQLTNLQTLCYVWGFLKYYHPQVAKGKYNWDMELFKILPHVKVASSNEQLSELLVQWIDKLGDVPECRKCSDKPPKKSVTENIDLKWMDSEHLSKELKEKLKNILANRHTGNGFYATYAPAQNLLFVNENEYNWREKDYPNELFRLQFLFRYWNTIHYFFPYKNIIGRDWNSILTEYIPRLSEAKDSLTYHFAIAELVNSVNDSHSGNYDMILAKEFGQRFLPVQIKIIDDNAVVSAYYNDSLARLANLQIGDVIEKIDGKTIKQIIDDRIMFVNGSNYPRRVSSLVSMNFIPGGKDSVAVLDLTRDGKPYQTTAKRYIFNQFKWEYKADKTKWKELDNEIGYVNMGSLERKDVDSMMVELRDKKAIIFDIRNYPKGTYPRLCEYLKKEDTEFAKITYPDLDYPGNFLWTKHKLKSGPTGGTKGEFHYKGNIILLVNELTQSHAEWTTMAMQTVPGAITVGSQTSGADGNASSLYLTGNYFTYMTGLGVFYPDGTPTQRVGVKVDVEIKPTVQGIKEGRDEVLEKAVQIAKKNFSKH